VRMPSRRKVRCRSFDACWQVTGAAWRLHEVTANLPDTSRPARWRLSGSREPCRERSQTPCAETVTRARSLATRAALRARRRAARDAFLVRPLALEVDQNIRDFIYLVFHDMHIPSTAL